METYTAEERKSLEHCLQDISESNLYIAIVAWTYGSIPSHQDYSFTELEYREAGKCNVERLIFLLDPNEPWLPAHMDSHILEDDHSIRRFREELEQTHLCSYFTTPDSLAGKLSAAVQVFIERRTLVSSPSGGGSTPAEAAIHEYIQTVLAELESEIVAHYVPLRMTQDHDLPSGSAGSTSSSLLPRVFNVVDRHLHAQETLHDGGGPISVETNYPAQFVLTGEPGAGKTTFLQSLEVDASRRLLHDRAAPVPLYVRLTQWPEAISDLGSLLVHERTIHALQAIPNRRLLVLLDELNEIDEASYDFKLETIRSWILANPQVPLVVASRRRSYEKGPRLPLPTLEIEPLDDKRVTMFIRNYLGARSEALLANLVWEVRGTEASRRLSLLARNPFILRLLCYIYERTGQAPPPSRGNILRILVETLYEREDSVGKTSSIDYSALLTACSGLAMGMIRSGSSTSVNRDFALKYLQDVQNSETLLRLMEDASLVRATKNGRIIQFTHQMLLEYFAAEYLNVDLERILRELPAPRLDKKQRIPHRIDDVMEILMDLADKAETLGYVVRRDPYLAAQLVRGSGDKDDTLGEILQHVIKALNGLLESRRERVAATQGLVALGDRGVDALRSLLLHEHKWVRRSAVRALGEIASERSVEALIRALGDSDRWVRRDAAAALVSLDGEAREILRTYLSEGLTLFSQEEREEIGWQLLGALTPSDVELRTITSRICGIEDPPGPSRDEEVELEADCPEVLIDGSELLRMRQLLAQCSDALDRDLHAQTAYEQLLEFLDFKELPSDSRQPILELGLRWLRANWDHLAFSVMLDAWLNKFTFNAAQRADLLSLLVRRFARIPPGRAAARRNRILKKLLGEKGEIPIPILREFAQSLVVFMETMTRRRIISYEVWKRLIEDLPTEDPVRQRMEGAYMAVEAIQPLNPGPLPSAPAEILELIRSCFAVSNALISGQDLNSDSGSLARLLQSVEELAEAGHLYRCRHIISRLLALGTRCRDHQMQERVFELGRRMARGEGFNESQRMLVAKAVFSVLDRGTWAAESDPEMLVGRLGFARPQIGEMNESI